MQYSLYHAIPRIATPLPDIHAMLKVISRGVTPKSTYSIYNTSHGYTVVVCHKKLSMKINSENKELKIKGFDKVKIRLIWLIMVFTIIALMPFYSILRMNNFDWIMIFSSILVIIIFLELSFSYEIEIRKNELRIKRQFLKVNYVDFNFHFKEILIGESGKLIKFQNEEEDLNLEVENGIENATIHIISNNFNFEMGRRNDGEKLMKILPLKLSEIGFDF